MENGKINKAKMAKTERERRKNKRV